MKNLLEKEFSSCLCLDKHHSLADGVFMGQYAVFPENFKASFNSGMGVLINEEIFAGDEDEFSLIKRTVESQELISKNVYWKDVDSKYLHNFASGLPFLEDYSLNFYMASWINLFIQEPHYESTLFSEYLFTILDRRIINAEDGGLQLHTMFLLSQTMIEEWEYSFLFDDAYKILLKRFSE